MIGIDFDHPSFSVIMPVWNAREYLPESVPAVLAALEVYGNATSDTGGELIIVDNGSTDGSLEYLQRTFSDRAAILHHPDGTVSRTRNRGARRAAGDYLSFVDADCLIPPRYFCRAAHVLSEVETTAIGSWYLPGPDPDWLEYTWYRLHARGEPGYVDTLNGGNLIVRAGAFRDVGGFDDHLAAGEDDELCQRLREAGYRLYEAPSVQAVHLGNPKTLPSFFRQQLWHGVGMLGTVEDWVPDRPTGAVLVHLVLLVAGLLWLCLPSAGWGVRATGALLSSIAVPSLTAVYRWLRLGRVTNPPASILLYLIYYLARIGALFVLVADRDRRITRR